MTIQRPDVTDDDGQIVKFRRRATAKTSLSAKDSRDDGERTPGADPMSRYESDRTRPHEYRQRMASNVAAIVFTALLVGLGIWLAVKLADLRKTQDCVLMGRRDCAQISSFRE